jgi:transcription antitermination factor NusA-like protein
MAGSQRWAWLKPSQPAATTQINPGWLWKLPLRVGKALRERIHGVPDGPIPTVVAGALRPAAVDPAWVTVAGKTAVVRVPASEVGRAIGRGGGNVSLASRLVGLKIEIRTEGRSHD